MYQTYNIFNIMMIFDQVEKSGSMSASTFSNTSRAEVLPSNKLTKKRVYLVLTVSVVLFVVLTLSLLYPFLQ